MAESSSNTTNSGSSPIFHIAQDHLFSILLLLPVDSILSFAMTCRRFKTLAYSDILWESICRREWGHASVDALNYNHQLLWKTFYEQVYHLDSVSCYRLSQPDGDEMFPRPRASHSLNFVSGCLVLFGGGCEGGRHLDDTWIAYIGNDVRRILNWQRINSGVPSGRFGHSCVVIGDSLVLFGGINDRGIRQNDTWVGQVAFHETFGITFSWRLLDVGSIAPPPRGAHAGCSFDNKRMLIHGGISLPGLRLDDTWILDISENRHFGTWHEIVTHPSPPARSGHTLTYVGGSQTVLFGGRGTGYEVLNDVWLFDTSEGHLGWIQLLFELQNVPEGLSLPRVGHSATLILGGRLLIYGGEDSYRHRKDDFWVLDISSMPSIKMLPITLNPERLLANMWKRLKSEGYRPNCRSFHRACADHSGRYLYVLGGMVDGLIQPAESFGSLAQLIPTERVGVIGYPLGAETGIRESHSLQYPLKESDDLEPTHKELELLQSHLSNSITVRSCRQTERKAKRVRAAEKAAASVVSVKSGSTSRKKRASLQEIDYSDPLRYLRGTTTSSRLLTATEEHELSEGIQDLLKLEKLHEELAERCGGQPTLAQWAAAAGVDQKTLRKRLNYGSLCKDKMIKSNIRLVISIAKNYQGAGMNLQDLVQEGCRGLVRGAEKFDASKGFKFSTYAHWWIKQAVRKSLSDQSRTIRLPFHMVEATYRVKEARKQLYSENGRHPDNEEVAEATGLSMKRLTAVLLTPKAPRSLDQKIGINQDLKPSDVIADPDAETLEDLLTKQFMKQDLEKVLDTLNPREKQVVRWRFGLEDGRMKTLQEIGELMGVSRERIRQIESCAFRKLKNKRRTKHLQQYLIS